MKRTILEYLNTLPVEEDLEVHDTLNPKLWTEDEKLKEDVRDKIYLIVDTFNDILKEDDLKLTVSDIYLVGSNANYNYTDSSDLDIHIMVDLDNDSNEYLNKLYLAYKTIFNLRYDITINDIPIELYVDNINTTTLTANGIYSVKNDSWIIKPEKENIPELDNNTLESKVDFWMNKYKDLVEKIKTSDHQIGLDLLDRYLSSLYNLRQKGLKTEGEYSLENQVFKELRAKGIIDKLKSLRVEITDKLLSL